MTEHHSLQACRLLGTGGESCSTSGLSFPLQLCPLWGISAAASVSAAFGEVSCHGNRAHRTPVLIMGPMFKQRYVGLLGLTAKRSFKIICKYPLQEDFFFLCLKKGGKMHLCLGTSLTTKSDALSCTLALSLRTSWSLEGFCCHVWDNSLNISRGYMGLFHSL